MADPKRVAAALQYQQQKPAWWDAVPVAAAPGTVITPTQQEPSWLDKLYALAEGTGMGLAKQATGVANMVLHPVDTAQQMYESGKAVAKDPALLAEGLKAMGERAISSPQGLGEVVGENVNPRNLLRNLATPNVNEMTVYHGTPHKFEKFDASKIGTGEGAQAYGHGLYFAENPDIAKGYRERLQRQGKIDSTGQLDLMMEKSLPKSQGGYEVKGIVYPYHKDLIDGIKQGLIKKGDIPDDLYAAAKSYLDPGSLYHVDLPDPMIERMLDWDKPLSEQPESVRKALKRRITDVQPTDKFDMGGNSRLRDNRNGQYDKTKPYPWILEANSTNGTSAFGLSQKDVDRMFGAKDVNELTGEQIISRLAQQHGNQANASEYLRSIGIPGIKYLDAGSRDGGKGTRNFVVFPGEESNLTILERK